MFFLDLALVGLGGSAGAMARNFLSSAIANRTSSWFSFGTLIVNLIACFISGALVPLALGNAAHLMIVVGFLGGFSTLGTLNFNLAALWEAGQYKRCFLSFFVNYAATLGAALTGFLLVSTLV